MNHTQCNLERKLQFRSEIPLKSNYWQCPTFSHFPNLFRGTMDKWPTAVKNIQYVSISKQLHQYLGYAILRKRDVKEICK